MERLGIEARASDAVEALSLGNQQRVQLGVALVHEPDLLVLDEPFSGLDPDGVDALSGALLAEIAERQVPVVFSSHQLELVERLCDSVAIIAGGRIAASGPLDEVGAGRPLAEVFRAATRSGGSADDATGAQSASEAPEEPAP
ncbi:MAG TPA: ATP-binding cassette domain-containing protein [Solirubrobacterales bacterium]|jgi:ABC-2 type transport system ATP-binding protein|nr:ATP-binding cassette domain-containing protein [Solirubrobacterales bacterium]